MIYGNIGGKIGYSSSKINTVQKKLFTPIQLSIPHTSDINNHKENSSTNLRKIEKESEIQKDINLTFTQRISNKNYTQAPKVRFMLPPKKKSSSSCNSRTSSPDLNHNKYNKEKFLNHRSKSKNLNDVYKSLILFDENFEILVNSIKKKPYKEKDKNEKNKNENEKTNIQLIPAKSLPLPKEKVINKSKPDKFPSSLNNPILIKNPSLNSLEDEAKSMTNTIEIANFYEYTKNCMRIIVQLRENKSKARIPNKVKILNPNNNKKLAVFDLDETLIHGVVNISNYKKEENIISIITPSKKIAKIGVNIRPHWEEAIKRISKLYTIVIYTASHSSYADAVLNFLDPENKYFYNRLYRSNCIDVKLNGKDFYIKDLDIFEGFDVKNILIVDNSVMAFAYHLDNGIPILPYYDAEKDYELLFVAYYFESLYHCDDLRIINKKYMKLDYYLDQAIQEYNNDILKEDDDDCSSYKNTNSNNQNINQQKNEGENDFKAKEIKKGKRRQSQFIEQYQIDFNELRHKFGEDEEEKMKNN